MASGAAVRLTTTSPRPFVWVPQGLDRYRAERTSLQSIRAHSEGGGERTRRIATANGCRVSEDDTRDCNAKCPLATHSTRCPLRPPDTMRTPTIPTHNFLAPRTLPC